MHSAEDVFASARPRLLGLAYRILGSRLDAEDIVQEAWIRLQRVDQSTIERPEAWLTTVVSRLALDQLKSARHRRESYVGPWLPEPVRTGTRLDGALDDPSELAVLSDTLTLGFLRVLESLSPVERVVFLLADVFRLPHEEIATIVDRSPAATRQLASRARRKVRSTDQETSSPEPADAQVVEALVGALLAGEVDDVVRLVADDVVLVSDGGAAAHAARRPVVGVDRVVRFVQNLTRRFLEGDDAGSSMELVRINSEPGIVVRYRNELFLAATFTVRQGQVWRMHLMRNPEKLVALSLEAPIA